MFCAKSPIMGLFLSFVLFSQEEFLERNGQAVFKNDRQFLGRHLIGTHDPFAAQIDRSLTVGSYIHLRLYIQFLSAGCIQNTPPQAFDVKLLHVP